MRSRAGVDTGAVPSPRRRSTLSLTLVLIGALALIATSCGDPPGQAGHSLAATEANPCTALDAALPSNVAALAQEEQAAYSGALRQRCIEITCASFSDAVRTNSQAGVDAAVPLLVRLATPSGGETPDASAVPTACSSALVLDQVRAAYRRAEGAASAHPPHWEEALGALETVPELPLDVAVFVGDSSVVERVHAGAYADAADEAARSAAAADWPATIGAVADARTYAEQMSGALRPTADDLGRLDGYGHRAEACQQLEQARNAELAEEVGRHVSDALVAIDAIPATQLRPSSRERSALASTVSAADREATRCDHQVELNDHCVERCDTMGAYQSDAWMDRCMDFCNDRAPLCFDQRDRWVAAGRPRSGIAVPELAMCRPGAAAAPTAASGDGGTTASGSGGSHRRRVTADDFE